MIEDFSPQKNRQAIRTARVIRARASQLQDLARSINEEAANLIELANDLEFMSGGRDLRVDPELLRVETRE